MIKPVEYELVKSWWEHHNFPPLHPLVLPSTNGMYCKEDRPLMASFLYLPREGSIGWMEWTVASPESTSEERQEGLGALVEYFRELSKANGVSSVFTNTPLERFGERLEKAGFFKTGPGVNYMIYV